MLLELQLDVGDTVEHAHALEVRSGSRGVGGGEDKE